MCIVGNKVGNFTLKKSDQNNYCFRFYPPLWSHNFSFPSFLKNFHSRFSDLPARYFVYTQQIVNASSVNTVRKVINGRPVPSLSAQPASDGPKERKKGIIRLKIRLGARLNKVFQTLRLNFTPLSFSLTLHNGESPNPYILLSLFDPDAGSVWRYWFIQDISLNRPWSSHLRLGERGKTLFFDYISCSDTYHV